MPTPDEIRELASLRTGAPVLSVFLRTDLRDPQNIDGSPVWPIELRNGLRDIRRRAVDDGDLDAVAAFERAAEEVERWAGSLDPVASGRSVVRFVSADGALDRTWTLQLPVTRTVVVWDESPYVLPLVAVADRGQSTGLVLVGNDRVRLLSWKDGMVEEPTGALYELEGGTWADYAAYAAGNPARAQQTGRHPEGFESRTEHHRGVFVHDAAAAVGARIDELGWSRLVIVGEGHLPSDLQEALPPTSRPLVAGTIPLHLLELQPSQIAAHVEPVLLDLWRAEARGLVAQALERVRADGAATVGLDDTARALVDGRVERLLVDPFEDLTADASDSQAAQAVLRGAPPGLMAERAVEATIAAGGEVTSLPGEVEGANTLDEVGGIAALLRY